MNRPSRARPFPALRTLAALAAGAAALIRSDVVVADPASYLEPRFVATAVRHALARADLDADVTGSLAARARASGWLPTVHLRVGHGLGAAYTQTEYDPESDTSRSNESWLLDVRLTFHLERLVFDGAEVGIQRLALERAARRLQLEREVLELLAALETARAEVERASGSPEDAVRARVAFAQARAALELLTGRSVAELERGR